MRREKKMRVRRFHVSIYHLNGKVGRAFECKSKVDGNRRFSGAALAASHCNNHRLRSFA